MPTLQFTIDAREDGQRVPGFPLVKTLTAQESLGRDTIRRASGVGYNELPLADLGEIIVYMLQTDQAVTLRLNDQSDAGLPLSSGSVLLLLGAAIPDTATNKVALENVSGSEAVVQQIAAGA